jgi:hypothetical protein
MEERGRTQERARIIKFRNIIKYGLDYYTILDFVGL